MLRISIFLIFIGIGITPVIAQNIDVTKVTVEDVEWSEGVVYLTSGEKLTGLLKLNTKTGLLAYENGATSKSFTPRTISAFEYMDVVKNKKRSFISVDYEAPKPPTKGLNIINTSKTTAHKVPQFFEILIEFPSFALLTSTSQIYIETSSSPSSSYDPATNSYTPTGLGITSTTYRQTEKLFIFDAEGNINLLLDITQKDTDGLFDTKKTSAKNLDNDLLEQYTTPHYEKLREFAKENKLSFKKKDDLLKILEHYNQLVSP